MFLKQIPSALIIVLLLYSFVVAYQSRCDPQDQSSLLAFSTNISTSRLNWSSNISCCRWQGVYCDINGKVTQLRLPSRGLVGEISPSIENLSSLTHLDLSNNLLFGALPNAFFSLLNNMEMVNLSSNRFSGKFSMLFSLTNTLPSRIHTLDISNNQFHQEIESSWLFGAKVLKIFNCSNNAFSGYFPPSICSSSPLIKSLDLSHNHFSGPLPNTIGECLHLQILRVGFNYFTESIPSSVYNLVNLIELSIPNNDIHGQIKEEIVGLTSLKILDLSSNNIFGLIPREIGNLLHLEKLYLPSNNLSGPIPPSLMKCTNLTEIILRDNFLGGSISKLDFAGLTQLQKFEIRNNSLHGTLPDSLYSCKSLIAIRVFHNNFTGQISPKIVELKSLAFFSITLNSFTNVTRTLKLLANCKSLTSIFLGWNFHGEFLPSDENFIGSFAFPKLEYFSLDNCNLTGSFPNWLSNIKTLRVLEMDGNRLTGKIPSWMGTLPNLFSLILTNNLLYGEIPRQLCQLPRLVSKNVDPKLNQFHFELPIFHPALSGGYNQYTTIPSSLMLGNNMLSGQIPWEIGQLKSLQQLHLGNNFLWGHIPNTISNLKNLEVLDLSRNNLSGDIPASLQSLYFLSTLNVSYNDFRGPLPNGGQFATFGESSFVGNSGLCGEIVHRPCSIPFKEEPKEQTLDNGSEKKRLFLDGLYVGLGSGFSCVLLIATTYVWYINSVRSTTLVRAT